MEPYPDPHPDIGSSPPPFGKDPEEAYDEGYYIWVINTADQMSRHLCLCYNCGLSGHYWADCTKPLSDSLKLAKERINWGIREKENQLNLNGGAGGKGAHAPQAMLAKANQAKSQN